MARSWYILIFILLHVSDTLGVDSIYPPILAKGELQVAWKSSEYGKYLYSEVVKKGNIGSTPAMCNPAGAKYKGLKSAEISTKSYCTLKPEYLHDVSDVRSALDTVTADYLRLLQFPSTGNAGGEPVFYMKDSTQTVYYLSGNPTGPGLATFLDPVHRLNENITLSGNMYHRFMQNGTGGTDKGWWSDYAKSVEPLFSKENRMGAGSNGGDLYIKWGVTQKTRNLEILYLNEHPLLALGELHKDSHRIPNGEENKCGNVCTTGKHFLLEEKNTAEQAIEATMFIRDTCQWMEICLNVVQNQTSKEWKCGSDTETIRQKRVQINFDHGIVKLPVLRQAFVHDFKSTFTIKKGSLGADKPAENVFRLDFLLDTNNQVSITTDSRERMIGPRISGLKTAVMISFSDSRCVYYEKISSDNLIGGLISSANMIQLKQNGERDTTDANLQHHLDIGTVVKGTTIGVVQEEIDHQPPPQPEAVVVAATKAPPQNNEEIIGSTKVKKDLKALTGPKKGYGTWGIFFGFMCGSFFGCLTVGVTFYFLRRSFFSSWYRGMMKRYEVDPSTIQTGGNFMDGNTTTGMTAGSSTMGTTGSSTMGTTASSTMGGTTGGGTTADVTSTSGTTGGATSPGTTGDGTTGGGGNNADGTTGGGGSIAAAPGGGTEGGGNVTVTM